ncbi:MAG: ABC transporter substrate-binding protein [Bauldia sp.]
MLWKPFLSRSLAALSLVIAMGAPAAFAQEPAAPTQIVRVGVIVPAIGPDANALDGAIATAAEHGAILGGEEVQFNAELFGVGFELLIERASGPDEAVAAATRLAEQGAFGVIGGYSLDEARALGEWSDTAGVAFINVGATEDVLRNDACAANMFHIEASAAMYLDALAGWYVRAGFRRWYIVQEDTEEGEALYDRLIWAMENRHFGARQAGHVTIPEGGEITDAIVRQINSSNSDLVILLLDAEDQLQAVHDLDDAGIRLEIAGYPYPDTQTRTFYAAYRAAAPTLGAGHRASNWEWTIDAYGAREYNARYVERWNEPMDGMAWATFHAVKTIFEATFFGQAVDPAGVVAYLKSPSTVIDLHKGIAVSFRPWDRQIRQSLFLIKILDDPAATPYTVALLVGELPAIYMPGTDPIERLDQLGDLANRSTCNL